MATTAVAGPISIGDDVWIGSNSSVVPGTSIATGCIIGANAAVIRDTEPYGLYGGVPARRIRDRRPADPDDHSTE